MDDGMDYMKKKVKCCKTLRPDHRTSRPGKILFIPGNVYQIKMFSNVVRELKNAKVLAIGIEKYGYPGVEAALCDFNIPFKRIQDFEREDPEYIIQKEKPDIVVILNDVDPPCLAFVRTANARKIPTLMISEGESFGGIPRIIDFRYFARIISYFLHSNNKSYVLRLWIKRVAKFLSGKPEPGYDKYGTNCAKVAAWGEFSKNLFIKERVEPNRIVITGNPMFDNLVKGKLNRKKIYKELKIDESKKIVAYAPTGLVKLGYWTKEEMKNLLENMYKATALPDVQLVIKPHPVDPLEHYMRCLSKDKLEKVIITKDVDLYELINACELLITDASVAGLDAVALGKPVLIVNLSGKPWLTEHYPQMLIKEGVASEVRKKEDFRQAVKKLLYDSKTRKKLARNRAKFVKKHFYKLDGGASKRVADLIEQMIKSNGDKHEKIVQK